jgi:hypothetical protein
MGNHWVIEAPEYRFFSPGAYFFVFTSPRRSTTMSQSPITQECPFLLDTWAFPPDLSISLPATSQVCVARDERECHAGLNPEQRITMMK